MQKFYLALTLSISFQLGVQAQSNRIVLAPALINELAARARTNHPSLLAQEQETQAAAADLRAIKRWQDPSITIGGMAASTKMRAEDGDILYGFEQPLPVFGKEKAAVAIGTAEVKVAAQRAELAFQTLRKEIAWALIDGALSRDLIDLAASDVGWLETSQQLAEDSLARGQGRQLDVLKLSNELARRRELYAREERQLQDVGVRLATLIGESTPPAVSTNLSLPTPWSKVEFSDTLVRIASRYEPELIVMRAELASAQARLQRTRKERKPDLALMADVRQHSRTADFRSETVALRLSIPWLNHKRYESATQRDVFRLTEITNKLAGRELTLVRELHELTTGIENARREAALYAEQIIPRSETAFEVAEVSWRNGEGTLTELLDLRRMTIEGKAMLLRATAEQYKTLATLVLCCGIADLEALEMLNR